MSEEEKPTYPCPHCNKIYKTKNGLENHIVNKHKCDLDGHSLRLVLDGEFIRKSETGMRFYRDIYRCWHCEEEFEEEYHVT